MPHQNGWKLSLHQLTKKIKAEQGRYNNAIALREDFGIVRLIRLKIALLKKQASRVKEGLGAKEVQLN